jgi:molybdenum cofactor cytidylyltransferase
VGARPFVSGIILAAGMSTRMGRPKQLLPLGGEPLLQRVIDAAAASRLDEVIVVLGHAAGGIEQALRLPPKARTVRNERYAEGMSTSVVAGLRAADARADAAALLLGDQPAMTAALIDAVIDAYAAGREPIVRPSHAAAGGGHVPGHPVVIARRLWPEAEALRGDDGLRAIIAARPQELREMEIAAPPPADIDTREEYEQALGEEGDARR